MIEPLERESHPVDGPPLKVLVADDDRQLLGVVRLALSFAGHQVLTTDQPAEVRGLACAERPDVIVLDVMMPVSGFEILQVLREDPATAPIPILFLSGLGGGSDRVRGLRSGADDYLVKPFEADELVLRIEKLGRRALPEAARGDESGLFGRYEVLEKIGAGSMGTVYRGHDPRLERQVALKTIRLDGATHVDQRQELLDLLRHEAVTIARLAHENIVAVYDMGETRDSAYIAMELVDGTSLSAYLKQHGPLPATRLIPLALGIARGLAVSHSRGVIHRDVKPGNVLLGRDGAIKVSDFGLAHVVSSMTTASRDLTGTPGYVPPEVLDDAPYTAAADVFGLGTTLYEALVGGHPLAGETLRETILNTMHGRIQPLEEQAPETPAELAELVMELVASDPTARPSAEEVTARLERMAFERQARWSFDEAPDRDGHDGQPA